MIEITSETIERTQALLAGIPKGAERAFSAAINRGLSHTKTQAFKQVKKVYAVKQSALNEATKTRAQKASTGNLAGYISFSGVKIPLYKFQGGCPLKKRWGFQRRRWCRMKSLWTS